MKEIEQARVQIEQDVRELEARLPHPVRSAKTVLGVLAGSSVAAGAVAFVARRRAKQAKRDERTAEVVVRVVHEGADVHVDGGPSDG